MSYYRQGPRGPSGVQIGVPQLTPWVKRIVIACSAIWLVQAIAPLDVSRWMSLWFGLVPPDVVGRGHLWQPLTSMFLHSPGSPMHLLFNMLVLWMFGSDLERTWGGKAFVQYYLICGVGAAVLATITGVAAGSARPIIGASGAIYGLIVAFGMVFAERTVLFMMIFPMKARTLALILVGLAFFFARDPGASGVSHVSHLGGALTGFLFLKRAWRVGEFYREMRWRMKRRRFRVMPPDDPDDRWLN